MYLGVFIVISMYFNFNCFIASEREEAITQKFTSLEKKSLEKENSEF